MKSVYMIINIIIILIISTLYLFINHTGLFINFKKNINKNLNLINIYNFLDKRECSIIYNKLIENKKIWKKRDLFGIMHTVGNASYLNDNINVDTNKILLSEFGNLYNKIKQKLETVLKSKVVYKNNSNLPGFHIFTKSYLFSYPLASFHLDLQYKKYKWNENCNLEKVISFTIPIKLPNDGAGLYIFNSTKKNSIFESIYKDKKKYTYELGKLYIHEGLNWHMIAPSNIKNNEYRITLQGHGINCNGIWYIYW